MDRAVLLRATYAAFNSRDIDAELATMDPDVDWPNAWEGGRVRGQDAVRDYWTRQWAEIDPRVEPVRFEERPDGRIAVTVHQQLRGRDGSLVAEAEVVHVYAFRDDRVIAMEVEE
jgi:ketosteroid isomerase-like protein